VAVSRWAAGCEVRSPSSERAPWGTTAEIFVMEEFSLIEAACELTLVAAMYPRCSSADKASIRQRQWLFVTMSLLTTRGHAAVIGYGRLALLEHGARRCLRESERFSSARGGA